MLNNHRYDLSARLIHFFREVNVNDGSAPDLPVEWGPGNFVEDHKVFSPLFLLRSTIRSMHLCATWSLRNGVRTIYGANPAVCLSDMPTAAFMEAAMKRLSRGEKISTYALTFLKGNLFELGARPVIYGLSENSAELPSGADGSMRMMTTSLLPAHEQYRYVTYVPGKIDWTHEREWRLSCADKTVPDDGTSCATDFPGLSLMQVHKIGVIVNSDAESKMILHDILTAVDQKKIPPEIFSYILVSESVVGGLASIRGWAEEQALLDQAAIKISTYFQPSDQDKDIVANLMNMLQNIGRENPYVYDAATHEGGGAWIWLVDNFHPVTRCLIRTEWVSVNNDGKYLLNPYFDDNSSLAHREKLVKLASAKLINEYNLTAGYFSVLGDGDPNGVPFFCTDFVNNRNHYNHAHWDG